MYDKTVGIVFDTKSGEIRRIITPEDDRNIQIAASLEHGEELFVINRAAYAEDIKKQSNDSRAVTSRVLFEHLGKKGGTADAVFIG